MPLPRAVAQVVAVGVRADAWGAAVAQLDLRQPLRSGVVVVVRLRACKVRAIRSSASGWVGSSTRTI